MTDALARQTKALAAVSELANRFGIAADEARVIKDSNNTLVHLAPMPIVAKVGTTTLRRDAMSVLERELRIGHYLAERGAPIAPPANDVAAGPHIHGDVAVTLWRHVEGRTGAHVTELALGEMLTNFHRAFADYSGDLPDFTSNLARAQRALQDPQQTRKLPGKDRAFLREVAAQVGEAIRAVSMERRPLHGDPHDGNILLSDRGPVLIDFEAACLGPYEWDLTSLERASVTYVDPDPRVFILLSRMRSLCVATWCWMQYGRAPEVDEAAHVHLNALRRNHSN